METPHTARLLYRGAADDTAETKAVEPGDFDQAIKDGWRLQRVPKAAAANTAPQGKK